MFYFFSCIDHKKCTKLLFIKKKYTNICINKKKIKKQITKTLKKIKKIKIKIKLTALQYGAPSAPYCS